MKYIEAGVKKMDDKDKGLYKKYNVSRVDDPNNKHANCEMFVLDIDHDKYASAALFAYARACREEFPKLAEDLSRMAEAAMKRYK